VLSILIDRRYDKREILEAYLNEIYWGQSGAVSLVGIGAVSRALFAKDPQYLTLPEAALLAGMIQSPGDYWPTRHPQKAMQRRNYILDRLAQLRWMPRDAIDRAKLEPLGAAPLAVAVRHAPYFVDAVVLEVERRYQIADLSDRGFAVFTTLHAEDQRRAEESIAAGIEAARRATRRVRPASCRRRSSRSIRNPAASWPTSAAATTARVSSTARRRHSARRERVQAGGLRDGVRGRRRDAGDGARGLAAHRRARQHGLGAAERR
jgi:membrane peptidoglycan carboxypeptidase